MIDNDHYKVKQNKLNEKKILFILRKFFIGGNGLTVGSVLSSRGLGIKFAIPIASTSSFFSQCCWFKYKWLVFKI